MFNAVINKTTRFDYDRIRQEKLASLRLQRVTTNTKAPTMAGLGAGPNSDQSGSTLSLKLAIVRAVILKQVDERLVSFHIIGADIVK